MGGFGGLQVALGGLFGLVLGPLGAIWGSLADRQSLLDVLSRCRKLLEAVYPDHRRDFAVRKRAARRLP